MNTVQRDNIDHHHTVQWQVSGDGNCGGGGGEVVKKIIINNDIYNIHKSLQIRQSHMCHIYNLQDINTVQ